MKNSNAGPASGKRKLVLWLVLFIVCALVIAACLGVWVYHLVLRHAMQKLYEDARVVITLKDDGSGNINIDKNNPLEGIIDDSEIKTVVRIDFDILKNTSKDVYSWIEIPGSEVAFPIVQHPKNNSYYLRRAINGSYDVTGCIYTQNYNAKDFSDDNTIIYGHYMRDGTKFGSLLSYMDKEYFDSHRTVMIYTPEKVLKYKVYAALPFDTRHILKTYISASDPYEAFLEDVYSSSDARTVIANDVTVDPENDKIITLSTCLKNGSRRYLVLAVLESSNSVE